MIDWQNSLLVFASSSAGWPGCPPAVHGHHRQASQPILSCGRTHVTFDVPEGRNAPFLPRKTDR